MLNAESIKMLVIKKYFNKNSLIGFIIALSVALSVYGYYLYGKIFPSTDNAYVNAKLVNIAPKIGGYVERIYVKNNQFVKKSDLLIKINPINFSLLLRQATQARLAAEQEVLYAQQQITSADANKIIATSNYKFAHQMALRYSNLYHSKVGSLQDMQKYLNQATQTSQALEQASAAHQQAKTQYAIAQAHLVAAKIGVQNAKVNESYTILSAPSDGYVSNLNLQSGQLVMPGQKLFGFIENVDWWIDANIKETRLSRIKPHQPVTIKLDMYDHKYTGEVQSISYASGSIFSLLPPENASGNWVKITRYFTVRILVKNDPHYPLRVGASATVIIDTR